MLDYVIATQLCQDINDKANAPFRKQNIQPLLERFAQPPPPSANKAGSVTVSVFIFVCKQKQFSSREREHNDSDQVNYFRGFRQTKMTNFSHAEALYRRTARAALKGLTHACKITDLRLTHFALLFHICEIRHIMCFNRDPNANFTFEIVQLLGEFHKASTKNIGII